MDPDISVINHEDNMFDRDKQKIKELVKADQEIHLNDIGFDKNEQDQGLKNRKVDLRKPSV